jgi:hypothetical protein
VPDRPLIRFARRPLPAAALLACTALLFARAARAAEHVIHISVDGLHPGHLARVIEAGDAPTFKRLMEEGAWTANARTDYTHTVTLPNHTCMITGRPVLQPEGAGAAPFHGYTSNNLPRRGVTLHNFRFQPRGRGRRGGTSQEGGSGGAGEQRGEGPRSEYVASTFDVVHDAGRSTAMYASKDKFIIYDQTYDEAAGAEHDRGRDKIDVYFFGDDPGPAYSRGMHERFLAEMAARRFHYAFVHYRDTDTVGHAERWGSGAYHQAIKTVDGYLADVLKLVETDEALRGRTAIVLSTDHGGVDFDHQDAASPEDYTIPVFVWGAGVSRGDLYVLNKDTRADPGTGRPNYTAARQPIRNGDTGNLALSLLGLGPIPGSTINAKQDLRVSPAP